MGEVRTKPEILPWPSVSSEIPHVSVILSLISGVNQGGVDVKLLNSEKNLSLFFALVKKTPNRILLLDYDGTLAPFTVERDQARPYPGILQVVEAIVKTGKTRLVFISGRSIHDLIPLLGMENLPEIWGSHGGERVWADGRYERKTIPMGLAKNLEQAGGWLEQKGWGPHLEKKPLGLALHWRGMDRAEAARISRTVRSELPGLINGEILALHSFDGGLELRPRTITKAFAVNQIMNEMPGERIVAYLGDDLTDEDAFAAVKGRGLAVLVRKELRQTCADMWIRPPNELLDFLRQWLAATDE